MIPWVLLAALGQAGKLATPSNHAEWRWHTIETEHFRVHYATSERTALGSEAAAVRIAQRADDVWLRMGDALDWFPIERITVVVVDDTDALRAWAWPLRGTVVISAAPGGELARTRSAGDPLLDVFSHELAHVFTHKRACPHSEVASYGVDSWTHSEAGPVAVSARLPVGATVPQWWSEGGAEFLASSVGYGWWSTDRVAGLRVALVEDRLLTWHELQVSEDKGDVGDGELAYQQGYAFFRWLERTYGEGTFSRLQKASAERARLDPLSVLEEVVGVSAERLYGSHLKEIREELLAPMAAREALGWVEGRELSRWSLAWELEDLDGADAWRGQRVRRREQRRTGTGGWNLHASWSSDGAWLGEHRSGWVRVQATQEQSWPALSDQPIDYGVGRRDDAANRELDLWIPARFGSGFAFVPGADAVVVSAARPLRGPDLDGYDTSQLVRVDLAQTARRSRRKPPSHLGRSLKRAAAIPGTERARDPAIASTGQLAFVRRSAGRVQLVTMALDGSGAEVLVDLDGAGDLSAPTWAPDGSRLAFAAHIADRNELWTVDLSGARVQLTDDRWDEADPHWAADGIYFTADPDGFRDVFRLDPATGETVRITRVHGAAGTPSTTPQGHLLYSQRTGHGWKSMALRRDGFALAATDAFHTLPAEIELEWRPDPPSPAARRYRPIRDALPLAASPELRVDVGPAGAGAMAGAWVQARDPAEMLSLSVEGLVGTDALLSGVLSTRVVGPDISVWGQVESDRRVLQTGAIERLQLESVGLSFRYELAPDVISVVAEGALRRLGLVGVGAVEPLIRTPQAVLGVEVGSGDYRDTIGRSGGTVQLLGARAQTDERAADRKTDWWRLQADLDGAARVGPLLVDGRLFAGGSASHVPVYDALRAGGDAPSVLRLSVLEPSVPFPGLAARALAGDHLVVLGAGALVPVRDLRRRLGPIYLDDLGIRASADAARAWDVAESVQEGLVYDAALELRLTAVAADQQWNSVIRVARAFGAEPGPTGDPTDAATTAGPWRVVAGFGTGW